MCWADKAEADNEPDAEVKDCTPSSIPTTVRPNVACCADGDYPKGGSCSCSSYFDGETPTAFCLDTFGGFVIPSCAVGGKLSSRP